MTTTTRRTHPSLERKATTNFADSLAEARSALEVALASAALPELLDAHHTASPLGDFVIGRGLLEAESEFGFQAARFLLRDSADSPGYGLPYRALLVRDLDVVTGRGIQQLWGLRSLESQCPSCFGTGVLEFEERPCDTCGGVGWGLREVIARTDEDAPARELAVPA